MRKRETFYRSTVKTMGESTSNSAEKGRAAISCHSEYNEESAHESYFTLFRMTLPF